MKDLISDGRVHVFDGAMGTLLYARGVFVNVCYDELNLSQPDLVQGIHAEYVNAAATSATTKLSTAARGATQRLTMRTLCLLESRTPKVSERTPYFLGTGPVHQNNRDRAKEKWCIDK